MRHVRLLTAVFAIVAAVLLVAGIVRDDPVVTLSGLLMSWAALVKIVVAVIWRHLGTDRAVRAPDGSYQ